MVRESQTDGDLTSPERARRHCDELEGSNAAKSQSAAVEALRRQLEVVKQERESARKEAVHLQEQLKGWRKAAMHFKRLGTRARELAREGKSPGKPHHLEEDWKRIAPQEGGWRTPRGEDAMFQELRNDAKRQRVKPPADWGLHLQDEVRQGEACAPDPANEPLAAPANYGGEPYRYQYVERNPEERAKMNAYTCPDCALFYKHIGADQSNQFCHHHAHQLRDAGARHRCFASILASLSH